MEQRVVLIESSEEVARQMGERLESLGLEVLIERDGVAGLETIYNTHPDLVYIDVECAPVNGFTLCRILKDNPEYRSTPIVLTSYNGNHTGRFWAQESGADAYLIKPYHPSELIQTAQMLIQGNARTVA